jgi:hypothetical protein
MSTKWTVPKLGALCDVGTYMTVSPPSTGKVIPVM